MIIAVTRDNSDLINQVCSTLKHDVQIMNGVTNIKRFAICEMRNLNNYSNIIIDLTGLSDTEEDVIKAVLALKLMYNIRITIIAIGYEHGNSLLSKLFNEGIYNFVISKDKREQEKELYQSVKYNELEEIKEKCELHLLEEVDSYGNVNTQLKNMVENAIELMYYSSSIKVNNAIIPQELVRNKLKELNGAKIFYALGKIKNNLKNTQNFTNSTKFIISCLYNAINEYFSDAELQFRIDGS